MVLARIRAGEADHPFRNHPSAEGRDVHSDFADGLADSRRRRHGHRRLEDRSRHQRPRAGRHRQGGDSRQSSNRPTTPSSARTSTASSRRGIPPPNGCSATRPTEAIGQSIRMLIPDELQSEEDVVLAKIRAGEKIDHYETVRQRKDGTRLNDFADRLADPRTSTARSSAPRRSPATSPSATRLRQPRSEHARNHREAGRSRRHGRLDARPRDDRPEGHRHRDGADARGVRRVLL